MLAPCGGQTESDSESKFLQQEKCCDGHRLETQNLSCGHSRACSHPRGIYPLAPRPAWTSFPDGRLFYRELAPDFSCCEVSLGPQIISPRISPDVAMQGRNCLMP